MNDFLIDGCTFTKKKTLQISSEKRKQVLQRTGHQLWNFPAAFLKVDYATDSGVCALNQQITMAISLSDETYSRGAWYYALFDAVRDLIERGDSPKKAYRHLLNSPINPDDLIENLYLPEIPKDSYIGDQDQQLINPNAYITPQGRCCESLFLRGIAQVNQKENKQHRNVVLGNGIFITTLLVAGDAKYKCIEIPEKMDEHHYKDIDDVASTNPLKGGIDLEQLEIQLKEQGDNVAMVILTMTNNNQNAQPVPIENMKGTFEITRKYGIPVVYDACRVHENAYLNKLYNPSCKDLSIQEILKLTFQYCDGFYISFKKFLCNMGGFCSIRRGGLFTERYQDLNHFMKKIQIQEYGNDSYGGMSGRDISAATIAIYESTDESYLASRYSQTVYLGKQLLKKGVPLVLPLGGHCINVDLEKMFLNRKWDEFLGIGFCTKMIEKFGIRPIESGYFGSQADKYFEKHGKLPEGAHNYTKMTIPAQVYHKEHFDYTAEAFEYFIKNPEEIKPMRIVSGRDDMNRFFVAKFEPVDKNVEEKISEGDM